MIVDQSYNSCLHASTIEVRRPLREDAKHGSGSNLCEDSIALRLCDCWVAQIDAIAENWPHI